MRARKKPVVVEAFLWTADKEQIEDPIWMVDRIKAGSVWFNNSGTPLCTMSIKTLEGVMEASIGDWIIKGVEEEVYPCKPGIFDKTYDILEEE